MVNASLLIYLPQIDCLHLLKELATEVVAPATVVASFSEHPGSDLVPSDVRGIR